jgi:hypothetical protein
MYTMLSKEDSIVWLQRRAAEYWDQRGSAGKTMEDFDDFGKLGQGFASVDELEEIDLGEGSVPRPTYVSVNLPNDRKHRLALHGSTRKCPS